MGDGQPSHKQDQEGEALALCGPEEVESEALLGQVGELLIHHQGQVYCLRRTGKGGLILTK